jgi:predicted nucleic acid-binding protein
MLPDPVDAPRVVRDPDDDYVVALAKDAGAEPIVSGDRDLLDEPRLDPPVLDPRAACIKLGLVET